MDKQWLKQLPLDNIKQTDQVSGGDVNLAYRVVTSEESYFLLVQPGRTKDFFTAEVAGLKELDKVGITVPHVIHMGEIHGDAYLLLSYLEEGSGKQSDLGHLVADMHKNHQKNGLFGFSEDYQGSDSTFNNQWTDSWTKLFVERRLDSLQDDLLAKGLWNERDKELYQSVREVIVETLDNHASEPSLLHGDLWSGNYMFLSDGSPALFDPASLYGDREFDIGITTVFGGFGDQFYQTYNNIYPLDPGYNERLNFYRLYMLMVHLNKFGSTYASSVHQSLQTILKLT